MFFYFFKTATRLVTIALAHEHFEIRKSINDNRNSLNELQLQSAGIV